MIFVHDDPEFGDLLRIVAGQRGLSPGLVEKDYWVTHSLWALHDAGFDVWFKGGTSLSKGFGLIQRFSEDLDLKIEPGRVTGLRSVSNWKSAGTKAAAERQASFAALRDLLVVPGASVALETSDPTWRNAELRVIYPGRHLADLANVLRPFVLLEVGSARVTPAVPRDLTSFVHEHLIAEGLLATFIDNTPKAVRCVHPLVTLLEKLDALHRRVPNEKVEPAAFVRHFEDAAHIIAAADTLPGLVEHADVVALAKDMLAHRQLAALPASLDPAFAPDDAARWSAIRITHAAIAPMFWGVRLPLETACAAIRAWLASEFT